MDGAAFSPAEGWLRIALPAAPGGAVELRRGRSLDVSRLLRGKPAEAAMQLVPPLFSVCEHAHRQAAALALGSPPSPRLALLSALETLREHVLRIALDWARFLGEPPEPKTARAAMSLLRETAAGGDMADAADRAEEFAGAVLGEPALEWLQTDLKDWAAGEGTTAARLIAELSRRGWMDVGAADADDDATIFRRRAGDPKLEGLGSGLGARMTARLVELARLPGEMRAIARGEVGSDPMVPAARGPLRHEAELKGGLIERYRIHAPTDVNFAPDGLAARCLAALSEPDRDIRLSQAHWLVNAIDPCVRYEMEIADA